MLKANQQTIPLGKLKVHLPHNFSYTLTNDSDNTIVIKRIAVGCGSCTKASASPTEIVPHGTSTINVVFTPNSTGLQTKGITVEYNGGPSLSLKFMAEVYG